MFDLNWSTAHNNRRHKVYFYNVCASICRWNELFHSVSLVYWLRLFFKQETNLFQSCHCDIDCIRRFDLIFNYIFWSTDSRSRVCTWLPCSSPAIAINAPVPPPRGTFLVKGNVPRFYVRKRKSQLSSAKVSYLENLSNKDVAIVLSHSIEWNINAFDFHSKS